MWHVCGSHLQMLPGTCSLYICANYLQIRETSQLDALNANFMLSTVTKLSNQHPELGLCKW
jgi:hypothetical protein